jgi:hypothetical protein
MAHTVNPRADPHSCVIGISVMFRTIFDLRFPTAVTHREQYLITVCNRRIFWAAALALVTGLLL